MSDELPKGAFCFKDCGCVAIAQWFEGDTDAVKRKNWNAFKAKAKRRGYPVESFNEVPNRDWFCVPHRAAHEAYKAAKAQMELVQTGGEGE